MTDNYQPATKRASSSFKGPRNSSSGFKKSFSGDRTRTYSKDKPAFSDRPKRSFGDRPARSFSDRPSFSDKPSFSKGGDFGNFKKPFSDRPARSFGDKPSFSDRPKRSFGDRPARSFSDRPSFGANRGGRSFGGGRPSFRGGGRNSRGGVSERIGFERFVNKPTKIETETVYEPKNTFDDFLISPILKKAIASKGYINPSPIQDQSIPTALLGKDLVGIANTGTGKTAAFLIPMMEKMLNDKTQKVIILAPTRELAVQIEREFISFAVGTKLFSVSCVGGAPIYRQISGLRRGFNVVVGTPGRILDLIKRRELDVSKIQNIVLDEVDRMLDMGFINDIEFILEKMPIERQSLFFSATMPRPIEDLIRKFTKDPVTVTVKSRDTSKNVEQDIVKVSRSQDKIEVLHDLLNGVDFKKVLIFAEMKHEVEKLSVELSQRGFKAGSIHGDKRHGDRQRTLFKFKNDELTVLVATDVAARGLDIPDVSHVINYEVPKTYDTYVHRIGRTGRGDKTGKALTFVPDRG